MVEPITQSQIDAEDRRMFRRGEIKLTESISELVTKEDDAVRWYVKAYSQGITTTIAARKVLLALSSIATVEDNMIIAVIDERTRRIMTTCLEISEHEFNETLNDLLEKKAIEGIKGDEIQIHSWSSSDEASEDSRLVRFETELKPSDENKRVFTTNSTRLTARD